MKKTLLITGVLCASMSFAQTTLFEDNFESGSGNWTLNGGSGSNHWVVNNSYAGFSGLIPNTPNQPASFTGGVNSSYMHITNETVCNALGTCNSNFDTGSASNQSATQTNSISTVGYTNVTLSFWYLCDGEGSVTYGQVEYSTNNGSTWVSANSPYIDINTWTNATITLPAFDNQASLKFRFRWQNGNVGQDPAFSVDEIQITGDPVSQASITADLSQMDPICETNTAVISIPFEVSGTISAGNIYTAYLSDATGSFISASIIGTLASSLSGSLVMTAIVPPSTPAGTGYKVRIDASNPAITGIESTDNFTIFSLPIITFSSTPSDGIICQGNSATITASGIVTFNWTPSASLNTPNTATVIATPTATTVYSVTGVDTNGCINTATYEITIDDCAGITENQVAQIEVYPNPATHTLYLDVSKTNLIIESISITDLSGRVLKTQTDSFSELSISELTSGKYILQIQTSKETLNKMFIRQ